MLHRHYHGQNHAYERDGVLLGMLNGTLWNVRKSITLWKPQAIVVVFDPEGTNSARYLKYADYKKNRPPKEESFIFQKRLIIDVLKKTGTTVLQDEAYEGDDLLGSLAMYGKMLGWDSVVDCRDKDLYGLVGLIRLWNSVTSQMITEEDVLKKLGVTPDRVAEALALMGDTVDNIPGLPNVGPRAVEQMMAGKKTMEELLADYSHLKPAHQQLLHHNRQMLLDFRDLVRLDTHIRPIPQPKNCPVVEFAVTSLIENLDIQVEIGRFWPKCSQEIVMPAETLHKVHDDMVEVVTKTESPVTVKQNTFIESCGINF